VTATIAITGSPNSGKTSLYNQLTGARQHVGNWPGQTVERHSGTFDVGADQFEVVDLPGTYGLVAVSAEEAIATGYLADEHPRVVVTVADAAHLSGSLHLVAQIAEAGLRQIVALNMCDVADRRSIEIDDAVLADWLGADVVRTVARRGGGVAELKTAIANASIAENPPRPLVIDYGPVVELHLSSLVDAIIARSAVEDLGAPRWIALQLLAGDEAWRARVAAVPGGDEVLATAQSIRDVIAQETGFEVELVLAERRFDWISRLVTAATGSEGTGAVWSDRVDRVLTHRWLGLPVFLAVMWIVLQVTADVTAPYLDWVDAVISGPVSRWAVGILSFFGLAGGWVESLVVDGILAGVGAVLVFVPVLFALYLMLALLEDSGYMARAAAVMERGMRALGIPGKAFLPMMVGFGCTVPAIYATRTLDSSRDRLLTGLITPFMSCGARLPVYVLLASVFFAGRAGAVVFAMYLLGIGVAVAIGFVLSRTVLFEEEPTPFVMVMPEFRLPNPRTVWSLVKLRTGDFIRGAGTVIMVTSVGVWLLFSIPVGGEGGFADTEVEDSAFGAAAVAVAPVMEPLGFGEWEQAGALFTGFIAKEVVVSTMAQLYSVEEPEPAATSDDFVEALREIGTTFVAATGDTFRAIPSVIGLDLAEVDDEPSGRLQSAIRTSFETSSGGYGRLAALAFMVFVLLYTPCMAAVAAFRQEFGTKWMWVSVIGQFMVAWAGAFIVFQGGRMLGLG
jgi:ferrous iron transport protein B